LKITVLTTGSRGDVQPYLALGVKLKEKGHQVRIAGFENYADFVKSHGLDFFPIRGDVSIVAAGEDGKSARGADNPLRLVLSFNKLKSYIFDLQKDFFEACSGADIIVYHPGAPIGYFAAQHFNVPSVFASPFPMAATREYPAILFYDKLHLGRGVNLLTHRVFEQIFWMTSKTSIKHFWLKEFGRLPEGFASPFSKQITKSLPTVISCSNFVFPRPADWSEHVSNTGFWFLDDLAGWEPSAELKAFLKAGPAPVYVGFGSVGDAGTAFEMTRLIIEALRRSGQRGILAAGWNGLADAEVKSAEVFFLESAPHSWLFPHMAAVVHHGGAGTTAAGLRAGVPSIIIPHGNDQFAWGQRVYELGVGPKPIPRKKLTVENLTQAISYTMQESVKTAAKELGAKIQAENGAANAAEIILNSVQR
jgi:sterol 3beta-glucosyltransferase